MTNWVVGLLLGINAWYDYKKYEVWMPSLLAAGGWGLLMQLCLNQTSPTSVLGGMTIGGVLMLISWGSRGSVGMGDGWMLCVTGIYLGFLKNFELLLGALCLCGICSAVLWAAGKKTNKSRIPFVPFLFASYLCGVFF